MNLFIAGCPRSGTTALTRLLNLHPEVVVGLERYKGLYGRRAQFTAALFEADRFFDFRDTDSNFIPERSTEARVFYERAREKFAGARFVGDKYPQFFRMYDTLFRQCPDAKVIFIFRDPAFVAQSWQKRADDGSRWPAENDGRKAVGYWNDALAYTLAYKPIKRTAFTFVDYEDFFGRRADGLIALLGQIGATLTPEIEAAIRADSAGEYARSSTVLTQELSLAQDVMKSVRNAADLNLYRRARRVLEADRDSSAAAATDAP